MTLLRFKKEELLEVLQKFSSASKKHKDSFTRAVLIEQSPEGPCTLWRNAPENKFSATVPLYNEGGRIDRNIVLEMKPFIELVKCHDEEFLNIQDSNKKLRMCTHSGVIDLENFTRMAPKIKNESFWVPRHFKEEVADTAEFNWFITIAEKSMAYAMIPSHRMACIHEGNAFMNFGNVAVVVSGFNINSIGVRSADFKIFKKCLEGSSSFDYRVHSSDYLITTESMKFSVPYISTRGMYFSEKEMNNYDVRYSIDIPFKPLHDIVGLISKVIGGSDVISLECKSGSIWVNASTKIGRNMEFPVIDGVRTEFAARMSMELLKKALNIISFVVNEDNTNIQIISGMDRRIVMKSGRVIIIAGTML